MRSTDLLIVALRNYERALDAGCEIGPTEAYLLEEALAALQLKLTEVADRRDPAGDSQAGADAADGPCEESEPWDGTMPAESQIYPLDR